MPIAFSSEPAYHWQSSLYLSVLKDDEQINEQREESDIIHFSFVQKRYFQVGDHHPRQPRFHHRDNFEQ